MHGRMHHHGLHADVDLWAAPQPRPQDRTDHQRFALLGQKIEAAEDRAETAEGENKKVSERRM